MRSTLSRILALVALLIAMAPLAGQARGPRHALVIGNGSYAEFGRLRNPVNDATDMAAALRELGFQVRLLTDADLVSMEDAVIRLGNDLAQSADSIGLFFYAGHGVQTGGANYFIPADAHIGSEAFLRTKALAAQVVLDTLTASRNALNVVVLDACRDNPFSWGRSASRGLSVVGSQPPGSIIVYATGAGSVAQDGSGRNGVFTAELLKQIRTPGIDINEVFKRTGRAVQSATAGRQVPAVYNQFFDSVYLAGGAAAPSSGSAAPPVATPTLTVTRAYGSLSVSVASAGILYLDGKAVGDLTAGAKANLNSVEIGEHSLELRHVEGQVERFTATVEEGKATAVTFALKESPSVTVPAPSDDLVPVDFVLVPAGSFLMGSPAAEEKRDSDEGPQHEVRLSAFYISKYELTFEEYDAYCAATGAAKPSDKGWGRGRRPVINVSWLDAVRYCNWRSAQEGMRPCYTIIGQEVSCDFGANGYRLPTEAEWEYAAKGGPTAKGLAVNAVYAGSASLDQVAWHVGNSGGQSHPVGQKAANALGLYDMAGNVWEWCWDRYASYSGGAQADPTGAAAGGDRVSRGGGWFNDGQSRGRYGPSGRVDGSKDLRSTNRNDSSPGFRNYDLGFRLVRRPY